MTALQIDDALRELGALAQAKTEALAALSALHRDVLQLLVTSLKDRVAHRVAEQRLTKTLAAARLVVERHGGTL